MDIGTLAVIGSTLVLLLYSGMLFDASLVRHQFHRDKLLDFGGLALANYVLIPLLTLGVIRLFGFSPVVNLVLLTMALLPCASMVPPIVSVAGEAPERSLFAFLLMSMLNIVVTPILMALLTLSWVAGSHAAPDGGTMLALCKYVASVFGPMGLGAGWRILAPASCAVWKERLRRALSWLMLISVVLSLYSYRADLAGLSWRDIEALLVFEAICVLVGFGLARRTPDNRGATILICSLRNVAMGLAFVLIVFPNTAAPIYMLVFTNLSFLGAAIWIWTIRRLAVATIKS